MPPRAVPDAAAQHLAARKRTIREAGGAEAEAFYGELSERLDAPDPDDDIRDRPVADVVAYICRDLGLLTLLGNDPWKRRTPAEVATLWARVAKPSAARPPGMGATSGLAVVPPPCNSAASEPSSGVTVDPTTPLLPVTRFRGK